LTGAIRGTRLPAEIKLALIGAINEAKDAGFSIVRACEIPDAATTPLPSLGERPRPEDAHRGRCDR
jgi:hypothetical protein